MRADGGSWARHRWYLLALCVAFGISRVAFLGENYRSRLLVDPLVVVLLAVAAHRLVTRRLSVR